MKKKNTGPAIFVALLIALVAPGASGQNQQTGKQPLNADTRLIESIEGPALYKAYCASCHGTDGKGSGPMTVWLKITTPDLTRISIRARDEFPLARVQRIISGEENVTRGHGTREMPVWGPIFSQISADRDFGRVRVLNLAKFIETIQAKE